MHRGYVRIVDLVTWHSSHHQGNLTGKLTDNLTGDLTGNLTGLEHVRVRQEERREEDYGVGMCRVYLG